jgi:hypothetical protein
MKKKIVVANNHWANIGDAFYQNSLIEDLKKVYGEVADVISGEEYPCHKDKLTKYCQSNVFDYSAYGDCDWYVLSGPILHRDFAKLYLSTLKELHRRKVKVVFMSVGGLRYDQEEIKICRDVLQQYPPYIFTTRDTETFNNYQDLAKYSYDGICSAFYSSLHYQGYETSDLGKYIAYSFDVYKEPQVSFKSNNVNSFDEIVDNIQIDNSSVSRINRFTKAAEFLCKFPKAVGNYKIVRLHHRPLIKITPWIYTRPNTFVSLNPYSYINIIKNAELTLGTRVHACVTALSFQKPAMLCKPTKRGYLFDRLGLQDIVNKPVNLSRERIEEENYKFHNFLQTVSI